MKIVESKACVECEEIIHSDMQSCPVCTCSKFIFLGAVLGTNSEEENKPRETERTIDRANSIGTPGD